VVTHTLDPLPSRMVFLPTLVNMKPVDLHMDNMTITMDAGALWSHAYHELINEHHKGYVIM
jgi:hypothetical protein